MRDPNLKRRKKSQNKTLFPALGWGPTSGSHWPTRVTGDTPGGLRRQRVGPQKNFIWWAQGLTLPNTHSKAVGVRTYLPYHLPLAGSPFCLWIVGWRHNFWITGTNLSLEGPIAPTWAISTVLNPFGFLHSWALLGFGHFVGLQLKCQFLM